MKANAQPAHPQLDLAELLESWLIHLQAERKSPATVKMYRDGVRKFLSWAAETGTPPTLNRPTLNAFIKGQLAAGYQPNTARARHLSVRRFSGWLLEEEEIDRDELVSSKPPKIDVKVTRTLDADELKRLIKACAGPEMRDRRDEALIRFMAETGTRAGEAVALTVADVDLGRGVAIVRRGKGGKGRAVPFGPQTAKAIDRYIRLRRRHSLADTSPLWLGDRGSGFTYYALHKTFKMRSDLAGLIDFHPHVLRHTAASRWLAAGGSEGGLMAVAGWKKRDMIDRYTAHTASGRAADEARGLNLGDF